LQLALAGSTRRLKVSAWPVSARGFHHFLMVQAAILNWKPKMEVIKTAFVRLDLCRK
jgi:hypothetical protein